MSHRRFSVRGLSGVEARVKERSFGDLTLEFGGLRLRLVGVLAFFGDGNNVNDGD